MMVRDFELIRKILLIAESGEHGYLQQELEIDGYTDEQVGYHVHLIGQAGLAVTAETTSIGEPSPSALLICLTWDGHEFIDSLKKDVFWQKAKSFAKEKGVDLSYFALKEIVKVISLNALK